MVPDPLPLAYAVYAFINVDTCERPLSYVDSRFYCLDGVRKCIRSVHCSGVSVAHENDLFWGVAQCRAMPNRPI